MDQGVWAAIRRFPRHRRSIEELALRNEGFRALCADLAEAETALRGWECSPSPLREDRCAEYRVLIDGLEQELRAMLEGAGLDQGTNSLRPA